MEEPGAIDTLKKSFNILMDDPGIIILYAIPAIIGIVMTFHIYSVAGWTAMGTGLMGGAGGQMSAPMQAASGFAMIAAILPLILIYGVISLVVSVIVMAAAILKIDAFVGGSHLELTDAISKGIPLFIPLLISNILVGLAIGFGFFLLILPGVYFALKLSLFGPACVLETGDIGCIRRSWDLTQGRAWTILGILIILMILSLVLSIVPVAGSILSMLLINPLYITSMTLIYLGAKSGERDIMVDNMPQEA
ncbi:MAG: hypothetical protein SVY15_03385 [Halobacteriota archaeon]|nr:hypothetical protein [Halobacteriota archaeon]